MRNVVLAAGLAIVSFSGLAQAQPFSDLGHALAAMGYTGTVWVNSFNPSQPYRAHGVFSPGIPINPVTGSYEARYGMALTGSGTVSVDSNGFYMATGTAHNPNPIPSDGSISIDLLSNGNLADGGTVPFPCGAAGDCAWTLHFQFAKPTLPALSVRVYRHVEGSLCGGELTPDLNAPPCLSRLIAYFRLPAAYQFTLTDKTDTNYLSKPGAATSALCDLIMPVCNGTAAPPPTPISDFVWSPSSVYAGSPVGFTDQSSNGPTGWSWSFQGGSPPAASVANPAVTFGSVGPKTVTLTASNPQGTGSQATKTVTVLDSNPAGTVSASAASVTQCQVETFTANVTGAPPLTYSWQVLDPGSQTVNPPGVVAGGPAFSWASVPSQAPGTYTGRVTVKNGVNPTGVVLSKQIQLTALPALTNISGVAPTTNVFTSNVVLFTAPAFTGATQVVWDYGDGKTDTFTDPVAGQSPSHTYAAAGTYNAKVTISNCVSPGGSSSKPVSVAVTTAAPLVAAFQAGLFCQLGQCFATAGTPVSFNDSSQGNPGFWDYDWSHTGSAAQTCSFTDSGHTSPVPSHTYATAGTFQPCLRVRRGAEQNVAVHGFAIMVGSAATITVSGTNSGQVNQPLVFSGLASNCTPNPTGWMWTVTGGGLIAGAATGSQITVSWATIGTKSVSAINSGCSGAGGNQAVTITPIIPLLHADFTVLPAAPKAGDTVSFDSSPSTGVPAGASFNWSFADGGSASGPTATHVYAAAGSYNAQLTISTAGCLNPACQSIATHSVTVALPVSADFSSDGSCVNDTCQAQATTAVTLTAAAADATAYSWDFGDGTTGSGRQVTHPWAQAGIYAVSLTAVKGSSATTKTRSFVVCPPPPLQVSGEFSSNGSCTGDQCTAPATTAVTLTAAATDATAYAWSFGDGTTGNGQQVTHAWAKPATYSVSLTAVKGSSAGTKTRSFVVGPAPPSTTKTTLVPLVAESRVAPVQSSDLYVYNPGTSPLDVTLGFRRRGTPDVNPPQVTRTIQPGATLFAPNALSGLFNAENVAGFITVDTGIGTAEPVITAFNSTGATASRMFGLTVPGTPVGSAPAGASQFLVGLHDTADRQSSFGLSNPAGDTATYRLRSYDKTGLLLKESPDLTLSGHDQRQLAVQELRDSLGIKGLDDYRVEVKPVSGPPVFPFASDVRLGTGDPSFTEPGSYTTPKLYLLGVLTGAGAASTTWQTDLLLSNTGDQAAQTALTFTGAGNNVKTAQVTVPAGSTVRLENALVKQLGLSNGTGVLTVSSTSPNGIFPIAGAETYDNTAPAKRYGQSLVALSDADAADTGRKEVLVGLRQDASNKTTIWIFNPSGDAGVADVVYRGLDGAVLGTLPGIKIAAGRLTQLSPGQHPLKTTGVPNGFTVEVVVKSGKALAAAQVVRAGTNDPAYIAGEVR
jgi:PKD repeat protein